VPSANAIAEIESENNGIMLIDLRAPERLRGPRAMDFAPVLSAIVAGVRETEVDLSRLRVACDWVQYKGNFREPVMLRRIEPSAYDAAQASRAESGDGHGHELAIDLRRAPSIDLQRTVCSTLTLPDTARDSSRLYLEPWGPGRASVLWSFNALYWRALSLWERASGREYEQALPGGESDARNAAGADELIEQLFAVWDELGARRALSEELYILELGVGNGNQARVFLDEFARLDRERGSDYYRRLHYLMGDYSPHVLERARGNLLDHAERISGLVLDATRPTQTLGFLRYKVSLVYISNVYDNLPTDEIARIGGHLFQVQVRAFLRAEDAERMASALGIALPDLSEQIARLLRLGPELLSEASPEIFPSPLAAVEFWREAWQALRLDERYVPIEGLDTYQVAPGVSGEMLRPLIEANGDLRIHVSNGAAASFADTLALLHPHGWLTCHDLFITDLQQYASSFRGPGKYDGSVVNWVNGPLLVALGRRHGYEVEFAPFGHRPDSNVLTLTTRQLE
jgi:Putative S-adenosyl-L-methionine-dependent methyltransferase